jgi:hypothetical protein
LVAIPTQNELLSSWLDRTAALHGVRRHHLLEWSGYRDKVGRHIDYEICDADVAALAHMMRVSMPEVYAKTHTWLGPLRDDVICRTRSPISCPHCADHLQMLHGAKVRLKHWTEAWRIRCSMCGGILSQEREEAFTRALRWHWYEAVIVAADRGSDMVEDAIARQCPAENDNRSLVPADVLWLFGFDSLDPRRPGTLSRLSFAQRFFLLAAVGAQRRAEAEYARHLLQVWSENRRLQRQIALRQRRRGAGFSLKINVNSRRKPGQSQIRVSTRALALPQSQN